MIYFVNNLITNMNLENINKNNSMYESEVRRKQARKKIQAAYERLKANKELK